MDRRSNTDVIVETIAMEGKRVVDVGCGEGHLVRLLTRHGASVLGVECSPRQLAKAHAAPRVADERIVEGVGQSLPAEDASADVVVFFNSLHHVPCEVMDTALAEAARVLVPGGLVYVSEPVAEGPFFETARPVDDETQVRAAAQAAIAAAAAILPLEREIRFVHTVRMEDYANFRERIISANSEREDRFDSLDAEMRRLFEQNATRTPEGQYSFDQPMVVKVLRKPSTTSN